MRGTTPKIQHTRYIESSQLFQPLVSFLIVIRKGSQCDSELQPSHLGCRLTSRQDNVPEASCLPVRVIDRDSNKFYFVPVKSRYLDLG